MQIHQVPCSAGAGTSKGMPATPRKMGVAGSSAAESPGATNAQQVAVDSLGLNIQISSEMEVGAVVELSESTHIVSAYKLPLAYAL